jgi:hypothetical protein
VRYKHQVTRTFFEESRTVCDGCGKTARPVPFSYNADDITIEARIGESYPEGDHRTVYEADVCAECWRDKVMPALASVGIAVRKHESHEDGTVAE